MTEKDMKIKLKQTLSPKRYKHTKNVVKSAEELVALYWIVCIHTVNATLCLTVSACITI